MPSLVDHDRYVKVPDPHEWQLLDAPKLARRPPHICIPLQNYHDSGKFVIDNEIDKEVDDDDTSVGDICQESTSVTSLIARKSGLSGLSVPPLQVINPNLRSSYIR
jgi:hypothetical protein